MSGLSRIAKALRKARHRQRWHQENETRSVSKMKQALTHGKVINGICGESRRSKQALVGLYVPPQFVKSKQTLLKGKNAQSTGTNTRKIPAYHAPTKEHVPHGEFIKTRHEGKATNVSHFMRTDWLIYEDENPSDPLIYEPVYDKVDKVRMVYAKPTAVPLKRGSEAARQQAKRNKPGPLDRDEGIVLKRMKLDERAAKRDPDKVDAKIKRRQKAKAIQAPVLKKRMTLAEQAELKVKIAEAKKKKSLVPERKRTPPKVKPVVDRGLIQLRKAEARKEAYANRFKNREDRKKLPSYKGMIAKTASIAAASVAA